jgi:hypothetical protein
VASPKSEDVAGRDRDGVGAVDEPAEALVPQIVDEDQAGLEVAAGHDREDRSGPVHPHDLRVRGNGEVAEPDRADRFVGMIESRPPRSRRRRPESSGTR